MEWIKKNKNLIITGAVIIAVLTSAFFWGDPPQKNADIIAESSTDAVSYDTKKYTEISGKNTSVQSSGDIRSVPEISKPSSEKVSEEKTISAQNSLISAIEESSYNTSAPEEKTQSTIEVTTPDMQSDSEVTEISIEESTISELYSEQNESEAEISPEISSDESYTESCHIFISCSTAIESDKLPRAVKAILPENGIICPLTETGFNEGETAFDILKRVCSENGVHLDFSSLPVTGSAYIKGINNLYEFDCGPVSGWMYSINGEFPNVGCSDYKLKNGDEVAFLYSCNLGADIGNIYMGD